MQDAADRGRRERPVALLLEVPGDGDRPGVSALSDQLELLAASTERAVADPQDLDLSRHPDPQGLGVAAGLIPVEPDAYSRTV